MHDFLELLPPRTGQAHNPLDAPSGKADRERHQRHPHDDGKHAHRSREIQPEQTDGED
jgi:hypothetical protein